MDMKSNVLAFAAALALGFSPAATFGETDPYADYVKVSDGFYQSAATYTASTDFYITSKAGLEYFRDLIDGRKSVADAYIEGFTTHTGYKGGFYSNNLFAGKTVNLLADIDLGGGTWEPIGYVHAYAYADTYYVTTTESETQTSAKTYFYGNFDGQGHKISSLNVVSSESNAKGEYGLFGRLGGNGSGQTFSNLTLDGVSVAGGTYAGAIVGNAGSNATTFDGCKVVGAISISGSYAGAIYGIGNGNVLNCNVSGESGSTITGTDFAGGLVGAERCKASLSISNNAVSAVTVSSSQFAGGLVGAMATGASGTLMVLDNTADATVSGSGATDASICANDGSTTTLAVGSNAEFDESGKVTGGTFYAVDASLVADGYAVNGPNEQGLYTVGPLPAVASVTIDGTTTEYTSFAAAIDAAYNGGTVTLLADITLDTWRQDATQSVTDGATNLAIDGAGHTLTIKAIESGGNGDYILYKAENLTVKNLTVDLSAASETASAFAPLSGSFENVTFIGGRYGLCLQWTAETVAVTGCTFTNVGGGAAPGAFYTESATKVAVAGCTFDNTALSVNGAWTFTGNTVKTALFEFGAATGTFARNDLSAAHINTWCDLDLSGNYWGEDNDYASRISAYGASYAVESYYDTITRAEDGSFTLSNLVSPPKGAITPGYVTISHPSFGTPDVWGNATFANATESFVVKIYSGDALLGQTSLVDTSLLGVVSELSWHAFTDENSDPDYWHPVWEEGGRAWDKVPSKVELWLDGTKVAENVVYLSDPDGLHPVSAWEDLDGVAGPVATVTTADGTVAKYTDLNAALTAAATAGQDATVTVLTGNLTDKTLDLSGTDWTPVSLDANTGGKAVTVEGNGVVLNGLNEMLFSGTWAGQTRLVIRNVTIKNASVVHDENDTKGSEGVGAFIGWPQATAVVTLENCHLVDSTVKGGHWTGGLVGIAAGYSGTDGPVFETLTIKDCSVENCTIAGKGSVGGVIGHGAASAWTLVAIEDTVVSGNTITCTGSSTQKAGAVCGTIGAAGQETTVTDNAGTTATYTGGVTLSGDETRVVNNTVTSGGTATDRVFGRVGSTGGELTVVGGVYDGEATYADAEYDSANGGIVITGGAFKTRPSEEAVADGYVAAAEPNADGYYTIVGPVVARTGTTYYVTLKEAITAANAVEGATTIYVLADVTEKIGALRIDEGRSITVDTDVPEGVTIDFDATYGDFASYFYPVYGTLTFSEHVRFSNLASTYAYPKGQFNLNGEATMSAFWTYYSTVNIGQNARVHMGMGDGVIQMAGGDVNVTGTLAAGEAATKTLAEVSGTQQLTGGYVQFRYGEPTLRLKDTVFDTAWVQYVPGNGSGTFTVDLDNAALYLSGAFNLGETPKGVVNLRNGSRLVSTGGAVTLNASDELVMDWTSGITAKTFTSAGKITVDMDGFDGTLPLTIVTTTGGAAVLGDFEIVNPPSLVKMEVDASGNIVIAQDVKIDAVSVPTGEHAEVSVPVSWIRDTAGLVGEGDVGAAAAAALAAKLAEAGDNGHPYWQSYVLGLTPDGEGKTALRLEAESAGDGKLTVRGLNARVPEDLDARTTVTFRLAKRGADGAWTTVGEAQPMDEATRGAPTFTLDLASVLDGTESNGSILALFADITTKGGAE